MNTDLLKWETLNASQGSWWGWWVESLTVNMHHYRHNSKAPVKIILTLSFEFPNNYSQKCVLWRNMPPPNRHGSPLKIVIKKIFGCPSGSKPVLRQVLAGVNQNQRDSPFSLSPVSHPRRKICPLLLLPFLPRPPVFPLFQLRRVPGWAHRRGFRALLADVKQKRMESVNDSLTNISPSLFESTVCVCAVLLLWEEDWWSPRPMAGSLTVPTLWREKPTWMRRQSGWRERARGAGLAGNRLLL